LFNDNPFDRGGVYVASALGTAMIAFVAISWVADRFAPGMSGVAPSGVTVHRVSSPPRDDADGDGMRDRKADGTATAPRDFHRVGPFTLSARSPPSQIRHGIERATNGARR
jgi:hypothetical protein